MDIHRPLLLICLVVLFNILEAKKLKQDGQDQVFTPHMVISRQSRADGHEETWGYTEVRQGARLFWWLHQTTHQDGYKQRPLILWLQGGPGVSGVGYGSFDIIGPIDTDLNPRNTTWLQSASLLFVDSPVGTGYSYVDNDNLLTTDVHQGTDDLITFTKVFFSKQPDLKTVPYYIFAQSYGGKFATEYAWALQQEVDSGDVKCNLKGYALGNTWVDPVESILGWGPELLQMSVVDDPGFEAIQQVAQQCQNEAAAGRWREATRLWGVTQGVVHAKTNGIDWYNILNYDVIDEGTKRSHLTDFHRPPGPTGGDVQSNIDKLTQIMNGPIRQKVGIVPADVKWVWSDDKVFNAHDGDFMKDTLDTVDLTLMNTSMSVIVYQGQLDLICNARAAMKWVQKLQWCGIEDFNKATRDALIDPVTGQTDTYVKANGRFKFYWNLRTGHAVPALMGEAALRMLNRIFADTDS